MLFQADVDCSDDTYERLRDDSELLDLRRRVEELWDQFEPYADPEFIQELASEFHARFWEMYLANALIELGHPPAPVGKLGPDLKIDINDEPAWIEATAPGPGQGPDAVSQTQESGWVREDRIVLRFQSAIKAKHEKSRKYRKEDNISMSDPFVVAVNGYDIPHTTFDDEIPYTIQAVVPLGSPKVYVDKKSGEIVGSGYQYRPYIEKESGAEVGSRSFVDGDYSILSGVLYSNAGIYNFRSPGADFVYLHNPCAENPLPHGWLESGFEYWMDDDTLKRKKWV